MLLTEENRKTKTCACVDLRFMGGERQLRKTQSTDRRVGCEGLWRSSRGKEGREHGPGKAVLNREVREGLTEERHLSRDQEPCEYSPPGSPSRDQ